MAAEDIKTEQAAAAAEEALEPEVVEAEPVEAETAESAEEPAPEDQEDELAKAKAEAAEMRDQFLRLQAEWDNFRKRTLKEKMEIMKNELERK